MNPDLAEKKVLSLSPRAGCCGFEKLQTQAERERDREGQTEIERDRERQTQRKRERETDRERQTERERERHRERERERERETETERLSLGEADPEGTKNWLLNGHSRPSQRSDSHPDCEDITVHSIYIVQSKSSQYGARGFARDLLRASYVPK
ncbi:hypothetical protein Q8A73_007508 [Channa argus]|nr:hypothetical protein Q8A73_007508 [Channa argus]